MLADGRGINKEAEGHGQAAMDTLSEFRRPTEEAVSWLAQRHCSPKTSRMRTSINKEFRGHSLWRATVMEGEVVSEPSSAASMGRIGVCR